MDSSAAIKLFPLAALLVVGQAQAMGTMASTFDISSALQTNVGDRLSMAGPLFDGTERLFTRGNAWAMASWERNELKRGFFIDDQKGGYKANIGYGQVGYDHTIGDFRLGASFLGGSGSIHQTGIASGLKSDSDYFGADLYGVWTGKKVNVIANFGYLYSRNDIKDNGEKIGKPDGQAWYAGMKFETTFNVGPVNFVPYYGFRFTHLSHDDIQGASFSNVNVWEFPVGVNMGTNFTCRAGWKTRFMADVAVVPTAGTRKTYTDGYSLRVTDSVQYQAKIGLNTSKGRHAFGVNYGTGFAAHGRFDQTVVANYQFMY